MTRCTPSSYNTPQESAGCVMAILAPFQQKAQRKANPWWRSGEPSLHGYVRDEEMNPSSGGNRRKQASMICSDFHVAICRMICWIFAANRFIAFTETMTCLHGTKPQKRRPMCAARSCSVDSPSKHASLLHTAWHPGCLLHGNPKLEVPQYQVSTSLVGRHLDCVLQPGGKVLGQGPQPQKVYLESRGRGQFKSYSPP